MKKLNNKGYMLIEIILAFVIAMGITYFMFELIIKIKNKNDDLLVKTLVSTDQAIIYNTIVKDLYENGVDSFSCNKIEIKDNKFTYNGKLISEVSEYANVNYDANNTSNCLINEDYLLINIPVDVRQLDDDFNVRIKIGTDDTL